MVDTFRVVVTGAAGFIGWKVCELLLTKPSLIPDEINANSVPEAINVIGVDNMNDYYDVRLKQWRLDQLKKHPNFTFHHLDIEDYDALNKLFEQYSTNKIPSPLTGEGKGEGAKKSPRHLGSSAPFAAIINLAARAGVRYSMENPFVYYTTNVMGTLNLLELCRDFNVKKFILASTSSLYAGQKMPFREDLPVNQPISPYAASKKGAEATCYTYHYLYDIDVSIVRYFTVYGPASRPDMSPLRFISWVFQGKPVVIYGDGNQSRDFTYVDDIARGTVLALKPLGFEIINLGSDKPYKLLDFLHIIEEKIGKKAKIVHEPSHPADMEATWADVSKAQEILSWKPQTTVKKGIEASIQWFVENRTMTEKLNL